jgi:hypothetical protein
VVAVVSLGLWWARDLRHGRRARQLVPAPGDDSDYPGGNGASGEAADKLADVTGADDPGASVGEFLSTRAPEYRERPSRPRP